MCPEDNCNQYHHRLLHKNEEPSTPETKESVTKPEVSATVGNTEDSTFFRILPVTLHANGKTVVVNAFFDDGSAPTMMSAELANELQLDGTVQPLCITWTDNTVRTIPNSRRVTIELSETTDSSNRVFLRNVRTVPAAALDLPKPLHDIKELQQQFSYLRNVKIQQPLDRKPELLIGLEHAKLGLARGLREGDWNQPVATRTMLGWVVHGKQRPIGDLDNPTQRHFFVCECTPSENLDNMVKQYFSTEYFGVRASSKAIQILTETTRDIGGRYETGLLWRSKDIVLPDSYGMAMRRLVCLERRLAKDRTMCEAIKSKISENLQKGYWRKLNREEAAEIGPRTWYLPIFGVQNPHKKTRLVYDAAATVNGVSLNSQLLTGPDLLQSIVGVLYRAREGPVAVADPDVYVLQVMSFGAACSPCASQWVKNQNAMKFVDKQPRAVESIVRNHYVDDMFDSFANEDEALNVTRAVIDIHRVGGFEIRNWVSNSRHVMTQLNGTPPDAKMELTLELKEENVDKILGIV